MYRKYQKLLPILCTVAAILSLEIKTVSSAGEPWNYDDQDHWPDKCSGPRQSPIDIETKTVSYDPSLFITRHNYNISFNPKELTIENNGHTAIATFTSPTIENQQKPYISGTALKNDIYIFEQFHFHWGESAFGSEHTINAKQFRMELHFVHWNQKYGTFHNALANPDGLAVIGVLFETTRKDNLYYSAIVSSVKNIQPYNTSVPIDGSIVFDDLLPENLDLFYRYEGSLTTPPCAEIVSWILYSDINTIGYNQIDTFRYLMETGGRAQIAHNFRERQSTRNRQIIYSTSAPLAGIATTASLNINIIVLSLAASVLTLLKL